MSINEMHSEDNKSYEEVIYEWRYVEQLGFR